MGHRDLPTSTDPRVLRISERDNVGVAIAPIEQGECLMIGGRSVSCPSRIAAGHKVALTAIAAGEKVVKYGAPIGSAVADIRPGEHVHTHNLKSDYLPCRVRTSSKPA